MMTQFEKLKDFACQCNCTVEKTRRNYEWWRNNDHSIVGVCRTIKECSNEIYSEVYLDDHPCQKELISIHKRRFGK
jgi:hypothetical protein